MDSIFLHEKEIKTSKNDFDGMIQPLCSFFLEQNMSSQKNVSSFLSSTLPLCFSSELIYTCRLYSEATKKKNENSSYNTPCISSASSDDESKSEIRFSLCIYEKGKDKILWLSNLNKNLNSNFSHLSLVSCFHFVYLEKEHLSDSISALSLVNILAEELHLIVGYMSGRISVYNHTGFLCLSIFFLKSPVLKILCSEEFHLSNSIIILYENNFVLQTSQESFYDVIFNNVEVNLNTKRIPKHHVYKLAGRFATNDVCMIKKAYNKFDISWNKNFSACLTDSKSSCSCSEAYSSSLSEEKERLDSLDDVKEKNKLKGAFEKREKNKAKEELSLCGFFAVGLSPALSLHYLNQTKGTFRQEVDKLKDEEAINFNESARAVRQRDQSFIEAWNPKHQILNAAVNALEFGIAKTLSAVLPFTQYALKKQLNRVFSRMSEDDEIGSPYAVMAKSSNNFFKEFTHIEELYDSHRLLDQGRHVNQIKVCPWKPNTAVVTDVLGRVSLVNIDTVRILYMWKGYRDAEVIWLQNYFTDSKLFYHPTTRRGGLLIYAPRRNIIELWDVFTMRRLKIVCVKEKGKIAAWRGKGIFIRENCKLYILQYPRKTEEE